MMWPCNSPTATSTARVLMAQLFRNCRSFFVPGCILRIKTMFSNLRQLALKNKRRFLMDSARRLFQFVSHETPHLTARGGGEFYLDCSRVFAGRRRARRETRKARGRFCVHRRPDLRQEWKRVFR